MAPFKEEASISPIIEFSVTVKANSQQMFKFTDGRIITAKITGTIYWQDVRTWTCVTETLYDSQKNTRPKGTHYYGRYKDCNDVHLQVINDNFGVWDSEMPNGDRVSKHG